MTVSIFGMSVSQRFIYLLTLACFKLSVGATLLLVGWDSMVKVPGNSYLNIAIVTFLSFSPATLSKLLFEKLQKYPLNFIISFSFLLSSILFFFLYYTLEFSLIFSAIIYFVIWIQYFLIENCNEKWFMSIASNISIDEKRKFSSMTTFVAQLFTLLGPILILLVKYINSAGNSIALSFLLLMGSIFTFFVKLKKPQISLVKQSETKTISANKLMTIMSFSMIWPCIAVFNMIIPIVAKSLYNNSFHYAAMFEIIFGFSMAISGIIYPFLIGSKYLSTQILWKRMPCISFFITILLVFYSHHVVIFSLGLFFVGLVFSFYRIEARAFLAEKFNADEAGSIIATANALSSPLCFIFLGLGYLEFNYLQENSLLLLSFPLTFLLAKLLFSLSFHKSSKESSNEI